MEQLLIIVAGVSSSGKSTLIDKVILPQLKTQGINIESEVDIRFAGNLLQDFDLGNKPVCIVHYNLLLQFDIDPDLKQIDLSSEAVLGQLLQENQADLVYLCYTPDNILRHRIQDRTELEPALAPDASTYPSARILANFEKIDQRALLLDFGELFENKQDGSSEKIQVMLSSHKGHSGISWSDFKYAIPSESLEQAISET